MNRIQVATELKKDGEIGQTKSAGRIFIFHWLGWRRFLLDFLIMQVGFS